MLSLEERLAMLDGFIKETTPEQLFEELSQYEAVGPLADGFLSDKLIEKFTASIKIQVHTIQVSSSKNVDDCKCNSLVFYPNDLSLAA